MFFVRTLKSMPLNYYPMMASTPLFDPLSYCEIRESKCYRFSIIQFVRFAENLQRKAIKMDAPKTGKKIHRVHWNITRSLSNVIPSHLADIELFDFDELKNHFKYKTKLCPNNDKKPLLIKWFTFTISECSRDQQ